MFWAATNAFFFKLFSSAQSHTWRITSLLWFFRSKRATNVLLQWSTQTHPTHLADCSGMEVFIDSGCMDIFFWISVLNVSCYISFQLKIHTTSENFEIYDGGSPDAVQAAYEQHRSSWSFNLIWGAWKAREVKLSPFNRSCIGISSSKDYSVYLHVIRK